MYQYVYDEETGGLLFHDDPHMMSKEPRPVYAREMDLLGFNEHWTYKSQDDAPYMWAESSTYIYRNKKIAQVKGGTRIDQTPVLVPLTDETGRQTVPDGTELLPIDIGGMCNRNHEVLQVLEQTTVRKIYDVYRRRRNQLDCFHVAFSGGKDSIVLLDLVKKALPRSSYIVLFGDTGMEFPDTYDLVDEIEKMCRREGITFARARSRFTPEQSWRLFGPPSRTIRWCCTVHKSAPQTIKLRELLGKNDYVGMDYVGVRAQESVARSQYEYESFGMKQRGQFAFRPILEWSSAEVWAYIYANGLLVNAAYKKGNSRAGCLFCPMGSGSRSDWFRIKCYPREVGKYVKLIGDSVVAQKDTYVSNGGWAKRRSGRDLVGNPCRYEEEISDGKLRIRIDRPLADWHEWIKTLGELDFPVDEERTPDGIVLSVPESVNKTAKGAALKNVLHKACSCLQCGVCQSNCPHGCISFDGGLHIEGCRHCGLCHTISRGCLAFSSLYVAANAGKAK